MESGEGLSSVKGGVMSEQIIIANNPIVSGIGGTSANIDSFAAGKKFLDNVWVENVSGDKFSIVGDSRQQIRIKRTFDENVNQSLEEHAAIWTELAKY
jgi:polygalacturonase